MRKIVFYSSLILNLFFISASIWALNSIGSPTYIYNLIRWRGQGITLLKQHRTDVFKSLEVDSTQIVMLGNSITEMAEWSELLKNKNVINRGVIGDGTRDIYNRLDKIVVGKPKQIFLLAGVNDLIFHSVDSISNQYQSIVSKIRTQTPHTALVLISVLPVNNSLRRSGIKNENIVLLNKQILDISKKENLNYIDAHKFLKNKEGALRDDCTFDGIHLNSLGYSVLVEQIKVFINP